MFNETHAVDSSVPTQATSQNTSVNVQTHNVSQDKKRRYALTPGHFMKIGGGNN
jgi:hypothetical protein